MTPVGLQVAPLRPAVSDSVRTCPPPASTRFNFPAATNPMADPSGAQNGCAASSVPASAWGASASRSRTQSLDPPDASVDTYASRRPSGETATDSCGVTCPGAAIDRRVGVCEGTCPSRRISSSPPAATTSTRATTAAPSISERAERRDGRGGSRRHCRLSRLLQIEARIGDCMQPTAWILLEGAAKQPDDAAGRRAWERRPVRLTLDDGGHRVGERRAAERRPAGQHLVQHAAKRPDVGLRVHALPARLLGRHVRRGAENHAGLVSSPAS